MPCTHNDITVLRATGGGLDDHETIWGQCRACAAYLVSTCHFGGGGHIETRPMSPRELTRYAADETRRDRSEWIADYQERAS